MNFLFVGIFLIFSIIESSVNGIYLNPYSYGSYDPAAEYPYLYNYYARYYNPNPKNPYAPYPTYMKPGVFRLPRMYQIDPSWAPYYPPNRYETLPQGISPGNINNYYSNPLSNRPSYYRPRSTGGEESIAIFPEGCENENQQNSRSSNFESLQSSKRFQIAPERNNPVPLNLRSPTINTRFNGVGGNEPKSETELLLENFDKGGNGGQVTGIGPNSLPNQRGLNLRPQWSQTQPTNEQLIGFGQRATLIRPKINHNSQSSLNSGGGGGGCGDGGSSFPDESGAGSPCSGGSSSSPYETGGGSFGGSEGSGCKYGTIPCNGGSSPYGDGGLGVSGVSDGGTGCGGGTVPCSLRNSSPYEGSEDFESSSSGSSSGSSGGGSGNDGSSKISNDFERLPIDRINKSPNTDSDNFPIIPRNIKFYYDRKQRRFIRRRL